MPTVFSISGGTAEISAALATRLVPVSADIARDFTTARGEADQNRAFKVERFDERRQVVGVCVHVVPGPRLAPTGRGRDGHGRIKR